MHFAGEDSRENDERWAHRVGRRPALLTALVFSRALAAYLAVPCNVASNDNYSHALTALSLARGEWGRLDNLRRYRASPALGHRCTVIETPDGGAVAGTGFGVALAIAPLYLVARAAGAADETILAASFNFAIAAVLTALAVALFFTAVLRLGDLCIALFSSGALALGTSLLSVLSRELWQHTLLVVLYAGVVFLLLRRRSPGCSSRPVAVSSSTPRSSSSACCFRFFCWPVAAARQWPGPRKVGPGLG